MHELLFDFLFSQDIYFRRVIIESNSIWIHGVRLFPEFVFTQVTQNFFFANTEIVIKVIFLF